MSRPGTIALATVCTLIGVAPWHAKATDNYPSRPVTIVVPFTPGGSTDIMARYEAEVLQRKLLVVSPTLPVNSVKDLIALAKSKPGELTYASSGIGTPHQIFAEHFKIMTGTDIHHIPYKGAVPGLTDIASGNVSMEFVDIPPALPLIKAGKLKALAVLSAKGNPELPGVPPLAETVPGYDASSWQGFFARAGTPQPIIDKLNAALAADFKRPETAERFMALGIVAQWDTPAEFAAFITEQSAKWGKVIRAAGIAPE